MQLTRVRFTVGWVMALAPFIICGCFLLMLFVLYGFLRILSFVGLAGMILPVWCIGFLAAIPLGFLSAVRIGRFLLGDGAGNRNA